MLCFIHPHLFEYGSRLTIGIGYLFDVLVQMLDYLFLGRCDKTQIYAVADQPGYCTSGQAERKEQRVEVAGMGVQLFEPVLAPGQVV